MNEIPVGMGIAPLLYYDLSMITSKNLGFLPCIFCGIFRRILIYCDCLVFSHCLDHGMAPLVELFNGEIIPSRAFAEGGIHEAIMAYEDMTFFEILAEELALRDLDAERATAENYDEVMERMEQYMGEFEAHGTDHINVDLE